ncbi:MAG: nucleotide exchange factor GrpE [Ruminococcaceae bacterium]|nr:nucleotide exchange factor GrpE [Oscillospiraceae bacterium]
MDKKKNQDETIETPETEQDTNAEETVEINVEAAFQELLTQLDAAQKELSETRDRYLRTAAEYENYRKRSARERENLYADASAAAVAAMLPVLDNLERALAQPTADEAYKKGVEMIEKQFYDCLTKLGITEIAALGEQFDPQIHNAVMHVEQEGCDDNTVVEVFQKGFIMGERVVRHAIVKVAN